MPGRRRPFEDNWTGGPHLGDSTGQVQDVGAGVAGPYEVTAHSLNTVVESRAFDIGGWSWIDRKIKKDV